MPNDEMVEEKGRSRMRWAVRRTQSSHGARPPPVRCNLADINNIVAAGEELLQQRWEWKILGLERLLAARIDKDVESPFFIANSDDSVIDSDG